MLRRSPAILWAALTLGCGPEVAPQADTGEPAAQNTDPPEECASVELDIIGPEEPRVGDEWTVWLRCDGATLAGAMRLYFDPPDFAAVDVNVVTFIQAGTATMTMQVGSYSASTDVTVSE